jgi:hypothetical protein
MSATSRTGRPTRPFSTSGATGGAGRTREEAEAKVAWMLASGSPICAAVAQRALDRELRGEG